jgi:signal transduction histidine kinase
MTRRIANAILLTVMGTLILCGLGAYWATREVLLADLDDSLIARAMSLPQIVDDSGRRISDYSSVRPDDRYVVQTETGKTVARQTRRSDTASPELVRAAFSVEPDGSRMRTVTLRVMAQLDEDSDQRSQPATITFSGSAAQFDRLLERLIASLISAGMVGIAIAGLVTRSVARQALTPLRETGEIVSFIDEQTLDRRIDESGLPPELLPVISKLNQMLERLEDASRQRQQFIADASHELRTPVAALLTALEVALRRRRDADEYRETLVTCLTDAQLLQRLIEALLSQIRFGADRSRSLPEEESDLAQLTASCVAAVKPLADARSIRIAITGPRRLAFRTQPDRLRSILLNLLSNAVSYNCDAGTIDVSYDVETDPSTGSQMVHVDMRDTGAGIAAEHLDRIFEPFYRVDQARSGSGNLGLGLYLVRGHIQALRGQCTVESEPGKGTVFRVRLPAADCVVTANAEFEPPSPSPARASA